MGHILILKGGSLSRTELVLDSSGTLVVRKSVSRVAQREYGFVRWASQLRKMELFNCYFPDKFPRLLRVGTTDTEAFFELEYLEDSLTIAEFLSRSIVDSRVIHGIANDLLDALDTIHEHDLLPVPGIADLYFKEEVTEKIRAALEYPLFKNFTEFSHVSINGMKVSLDIEPVLTAVADFLKKHAKVPNCLTHGNPTLENVLYSPKTGKIHFIDPYEESIWNSAALDYAMVRQSSRGAYETICRVPVSVERDVIQSCGLVSENRNLALFDSIVLHRIKSNGISRLVDVLEATQYFRMLPFKCGAGDIDRARLFYAYGICQAQKALL